MKQFLDEDFLLESETAKILYHDYAEKMPVIDYHCHLPVQQIADDISFENLTQIWLYGDHYKWRAMRANGIDDSYCTGDRSDYERFEKWAETVPYTLRNPLYHWTHLELQRYFDVHEILNSKSSKMIYDTCSEKLKSKEYSVKNLLRKMNVEVVCTTDDPVDTLEYHKRLKDDDFEIKVLPAFRADKAMSIDNTHEFNNYINQLEATSNISISSYPTFLDALKQRHDFFATMGCTVSDHGLEHLYAEDYTQQEVVSIFGKIQSNKPISEIEKLKFKSALLYQLAIWDHEKGWIQQFHLGPLRNNNQRMLLTSGPDTGWDSIGDFQQGVSLSRFLDKLDATGQLAKTIL